MSSAEPNEDKAKPQESPGVRPNRGSALSSAVGSSPVSPGAPARPVTLAALEETVYLILGHGAYQRRFLQCCAVGATVALMQYLAYLLIGQRVDHWCQPPDELAHLSADDWKNMSIPVDAEGNYSQCTVYTMSSSPSKDNSLGSRQRAWKINLFFNQLQDEEHGKKAIESCYKWDYDISDWRNSIVSRFDLVCERRYLYDLSTVVPPLVYALLSPVAGLASDRLGRKPVTCACSCVFLAGAVGCSAAVNYPFFFINRILVLASASATYLVTFILLYEVTGKEERWLYTLLHTAVAGTIVPPMMHLLAEAKPSWMISHAFLIAPSTVYAAMTFYLDESPAWLLATWRTREAEVAVLAAAKLNWHGREEGQAGITTVARGDEQAEARRRLPSVGS
ncbi:hypothetical protein HPB50_019360 [Hyalomma asiaticum]|uniref:Uncharacterized protein n=1 Tax=Hyalomma asiaticum TaxID=266040 RepID=A0ACB7SIS4_HYAAI|nr:hypothetical protein HPB50_019360 [Hyalomma asiaticum]